jgi:hypothetical protein
MIRWNIILNAKLLKKKPTPLFCCLPFVPALIVFIITHEESNHQRNFLKKTMCIDTRHRNLTLRQRHTLNMTSTNLNCPCGSNSKATAVIDDCVHEIRSMRRREPDYKVRDYFDCTLLPSTQAQRVVDENCRFQMCEWCYQIIDHCGFDKETASIAMNILDRFLECTPWALMDMSAFQLAAITALYTSIKIHESQAIAVESMVVLSRDAYTEEQIEAMERMMLEATKWLLNPPTATAFGWRMARMISSMDEMRFPFATLLELANVQLEAAVRDFGVGTMTQSLVAIGAIMNGLESLGMTSEIEQQQTLSNLCSVLEITDTGMDYMNAVRNRLYENLSGSTPSPSATYMAESTIAYDSDTSLGKADQDSTVNRPISPNSVSAIPTTQPHHEHKHSPQLLPNPYTQQAV